MGVGNSLRRAVGYFGGSSQDAYDDYDDDGYEQEPDVYEREDLVEERSNVRPLRLVSPAVRHGFFVASPYAFDDVQSIAANLKRDISVIVDLHGTDDVLAERVVDFCGGLAYALDGNVYRIGEQVLLISPRCVDLSAELGADVFQHRIFSRE
jgi:SepF-like predicted cell division protein (DUF552 family)